MSNYLMIDGNKIPISDETASNLREEFGKKEKRFYKGERFVTKFGVKYMLAGVGNYPVLISLNSGADKNGLDKSKSFQFEKRGKHYVTRLPTSIPQDFGLDKKYGM